MGVMLSYDRGMAKRRAEEPWVPTKAQLTAAHGKTLPDVIAPNLKVLFCGINPGLYTAAIGHHFGRPGNRFWPALYQAGFTSRLLSPFEEHELLPLGYGITNVVDHATAAADELQDDDYRVGGKKLVKKVERYNPGVLAILGVGAYRVAFGRKAAKVGRQDERIGTTELWVLPNPSGLNAHFQKPEMANVFRQLRDAVG
jgi:TDG/mug DNA glycosylase family protein